MAKAELLKDFILKWEGGFSDHPADRGGATNKGITLATFRQFYGKDSTVDDLRSMTDAQWLHIFKTGYWDRWKADDIESQSVANILVDWVWASGVYGIKEPQKLLGLTADGIVGPATLKAVNSQDAKEFFEKLKEARISFVERIVASNPSQKVFLNGWKNRINDFKFVG